jgi:hypothetical protein
VANRDGHGPHDHPPDASHVLDASHAIVETTHRAAKSAFDARRKDPEFLAEIGATKLDFEPLSGMQLQNLVETATKVSKAVLNRAARAE